MPASAVLVQTGSMRFADWSDTETHDLRWAARQGRSVEDIAQYLGRSAADVEHKARELGIAVATPAASEVAPDASRNTVVPIGPADG